MQLLTLEARIHHSQTLNTLLFLSLGMVSFNFGTSFSFL